MLTVKKQLTAFGLLLIVALPLFFSVFTYVKQQLLQHQRRQRFKTELMVTISVKAEKVNWIEDRREAEIDGNLFDVEHYEINGSDIVLTGFYDHEEKLVKHINEIEQQKSKSESPFSQLTVKFLFFATSKVSTSLSIQNNWKNISSNYPVYAESISTMAYPAISPPPKNC